MNPPLLQCENLRHRWNKKEEDVLQVDELTIQQGEQVFIFGPSGSGKSTLLSLCGGILKPTSGSIKVLGQDLSRLSDAKLDRFRVDHIGFVFQLFNLVTYLDIFENISLPLRFSKKRRSSLKLPVREEIERVCSSLGILDQLQQKRPVSQLSIGQQQRVAAARALIGTPEVIIADEPTSALDEDSRNSFMDLLMSESQKHGSTLLFVSHEQSLANNFARKIDLLQLNKAGKR